MPENDTARDYENGRRKALRRDVSGAIPHFTRTLAAEPTHAGAYFNAGACLAQLRFFDLSVVCYTVCGVICDCITGADERFAIDLAQYALSTQILQRELGARYGEIQDQVYGVFSDDPRTANRVLRADFENLARIVGPAIEKAIRDVQR